MATNLHLALEVRGKIVSALHADTALAAMIPVPRQYPATVPSSPVRPFAKMGAPIVTPEWIDGQNGCIVSSAVHVFVNASSDILDPEAFALTACSHIVRILDAMDDIAVGDGLTLDIFPRQAQSMQDGDDSSYHGFVTFDAMAG